jgi:hypothetical protein
MSSVYTLVQAKYPKEHAPTAHVPALRFGQARCSIPRRRRRTRCAAWPLHSNHRGEAVHGAAVSFGTAARPGLCAPSHGQKGEGENRIPALREQCRLGTWSPSYGHLPLRHTAGAAVIPLLYTPAAHSTQGRMAAVGQPFRRLTCRGCSSGALQARREFRGRPCVLGDAGCPGATAPGSGIEGRILGLPSCASKKVGRPPGRVPASEYHFTAVTEISI